MHWRKIVLINVAALIVGLLIYECAPRSPSITKGKDRLGVVHFNEHSFVRTDLRDGSTKIITSLDYVVKKLSGSPFEELLFSMIDNPDERHTARPYSETIYAVRLDGSFRTRLATQQDWNRAEQVLNLPQSAQYDYPSATFKRHSELIETPQALQYRGKLFAKTGRSFDTSLGLFSPSVKWLAVFSHTSRKPLLGGMGWSGLGAAQYGSGTMFVDVYNAASGKKVMAGNGPHGGAPAFDYALWVEDEYLVVPLSFRKDDCFLGIMPSR